MKRVISDAKRLIKVDAVSKNITKVEFIKGDMEVNLNFPQVQEA